MFSYNTEQLNQIAPSELEQHGLIRHSDCGNRAPNKGYECYNCNSGRGKNRSGALDFDYTGGIWQHTCRSCGAGGDNIKLFQAVFHSDFSDACRHASEMFNIFTIDDSTHSHHSDKSFAYSRTPTVKRFKLPDKATDPQQLPLIQADIQRGHDNLKNLPKDQRRGIFLETFDFFNCGYLDKWIHPVNVLKHDNLYPSRRIIIPTSDNAHYLACKLNKDRKKGDKLAKQHAGTRTEVFNAADLKEQTVIVVEGEIDAMSIFQTLYASSHQGNFFDFKDKNIGVVATTFAAGWQSLIAAHIDAGLIEWRKFIILFDADDAGRNNANNFKAALAERNFPASVKFFADYAPDLDGKVDANSILTQCGALRLKGILRHIIADANAEFNDIQNQTTLGFDNPVQNNNLHEDNEMDLQINAWQQANGVIDPNLISCLYDESKRIDSLTDFAAAAYDTTTLNHLGAMRYYSFFNSTVDRFLINLRDAKSAAKKKIATYKKACSDAEKVAATSGSTPEVSAPAPSNADKILADTDIKSVERKITSASTQAKRDHKKFRAQKEADDINAREQARHEDYVRNVPTTASVKGCPVNLELPEGVTFSENGIRVTDMDKPAGQNGRPVIEATQNPVVPTRILFEPDNNFTQYEIAIKTSNGWHRQVFDGKTLMDARSVAELNNFGVKIVNTTFFAKFNAKIIGINDANGLLPKIKTYSKPGWINLDSDDRQFIYPLGGDDYIVRRQGVDYEKSFAVKGDPNAWKDMFREVFNTNVICRFAIGVAAVAPLLRPLYLTNLQAYIYGKSGIGKTALPKFCASIWGNPAKGRLSRTFDATPKNRLETSVAHNDLFLVIDERETLPEMREGRTSTIQYNFEQGIGNQANKRNGTSREPVTFAGAILMTGEQELVRNNAKRGEKKRVISLRLTSLFDDDFAKNLHVFSEKNFGHFGRSWIQNFIMPNFDNLKNEFDRLLADCNFPRHDPTHVKHVVAAILCAYHFWSFIFPDDAPPTYEQIKSDIKSILDMLPTSDDMDDTKSAFELLQSYVGGHIAYFALEGHVNSVTGDEHRMPECFGKIFKDGSVAFFKDRLQKIIEKELGFPSCDKFINECADQGRLATNPGKLTRVIRIDGKNVKAICIKNIVSEAGDDNEEINPDDYAAPEV